MKKNVFYFSRSPDLTPMDFFLWGYLKEKIYALEPANQMELIARLHAAVATVDAAMLQEVRRETVRRVHACLDAEGGHFEQVL